MFIVRLILGFTVLILLTLGFLFTFDISVPSITEVETVGLDQGKIYLAENEPCGLASECKPSLYCDADPKTGLGVCKKLEGVAGPYDIKPNVPKDNRTEPYDPITDPNTIVDNDGYELGIVIKD